MRSLHLLLLALTVLVCASQNVMNAGTLCGPANSKGVQNCTLCNQWNCKLPNCYCASTSIPGNIPLAQTPQFVVMTFDDSLSQQFIDDVQMISRFAQNQSLKDSRGCHPRPTFYAMSDDTDYQTV